MARDTAPSESIVNRIADLRRRLVDADAPARINTLRKQRSDAATEVTKAAHAAQSLAGTMGTAEALASAQARERAVNAELHRAGQRVYQTADAAVPELAELAAELSEAAAALAGLMREVGQHVSDCARRNHGALEQWPMADASSRGLGALAHQLAAGPPKPPPKIIGLGFA